MTVLPVKLSDSCPVCSALVRVYQDYPQGRIVVRDWDTQSVHVCPGQDGKPEEIVSLGVCDVCGALSDEELIGQIARTTWNRTIEWYAPYPGRPYEPHVCVPAAKIRQIASNPRPLRETVEALRSLTPKPITVPQVTHG